MLSITRLYSVRSSRCPSVSAIEVNECPDPTALTRSPFEAAPSDATVNPQTDRDYAWATVSVHRSGNVDIKVYGFNDQFGPTQVLQSAILPH